MTDTKISDLPAASAAAAANEFAINEAGTSKKLTAAQLTAFMHLRTTYASRPAAGVAGRVWYGSDCPLMAVDDGANWNQYFLTFNVTDPSVLSWNWLNQGSATADDSKGRSRLLETTGAGNSALRGRILAKPSVPYTRKALCVFDTTYQAASDNQSWRGIGFHEAATDKWLAVGINGGNPTHFRVVGQTGFTAYGNIVGTQILGVGIPPYVWFRIGETSTNVTLEYSYDDTDYVLMYDVAKTTPFTTAPDNVGFFVNGDFRYAGMSISLYSWG